MADMNMNERFPYQTVPDTNVEELNCKKIMERFVGHDFNDEMRVSNKYLDYAVALEKEGKDCLARRVYEMGYEEYTHARFQMETLIDEGYAISDEDRVMYENLKHRIKTLFRKS